MRLHFFLLPQKTREQKTVKHPLIKNFVNSCPVHVSEKQSFACSYKIWITSSFRHVVSRNPVLSMFWIPADYMPEWRGNNLLRVFARRASCSLKFPFHSISKAKLIIIYFSNNILHFKIQPGFCYVNTWNSPIFIDLQKNNYENAKVRKYEIKIRKFRSS